MSYMCSNSSCNKVSEAKRYPKDWKKLRFNKDFSIPRLGIYSDYVDVFICNKCVKEKIHEKGYNTNIFNTIFSYKVKEFKKGDKL